MQVQNHVWGPAIMTFATAAANIPINMVLIKYYDFWGAALATSVARILLLLLLCGELALHPLPNYYRLRPTCAPFTSHLHPAHMAVSNAACYVTDSQFVTEHQACAAHCCNFHVAE